VHLALVCEDGHEVAGAREVRAELRPAAGTA
jgi:hypothetical protein